MLIHTVGHQLAPFLARLGLPNNRTEGANAIPLAIPFATLLLELVLAREI